MFKHKRIIYMGLLWCLSIANINSQSNPMDGPLPLDHSIKYGRLGNGFTYYIKSLERPQSRIKMRFYISAGKDEQNPDQLDIAHAIEHLAFKCAEHFPNRISTDKELLNRLGMQKSDITGMTLDKFTNYFFDVPPKRPDAMDTGLLWFNDIAINLKFSDTVVDRERGVLKQELIFRNGDNLDELYLDSKLRSELFPCKRDWSDYFEYNRTFESKSLVEFYRNWYRPDLMGLVIVGNIGDVAEIEQKIKERFSDIEPHEDPRERKTCTDDYFKRPPQFIVHERKSSSTLETRKTVEFRLFFRDQKLVKKIYPWEGIKRESVWKLLLQLINDRAKEVKGQYNSNYGIHSNFIPSLGVSVKITSENGNMQKALKETIVLLQQIKRYGFSLKEWENAKIKQLRTMDQMENDEGNYWVQQIQNHHIYGEALPDNKSKLLKNWLSKLNLDTINALARQFISDMPEDILIIAPTGTSALSCSEEEIRDWIRNVQNRPVPSYSVPKIPEKLIDPDSLSMLGKVGYMDLGKQKTGSREILLDNGVKVVLHSYMPSDNRYKERVMIHGFSTKGASNYPKEDYFSAINATGIIHNSGAGDFNKFELNRFLTDKGLHMGLYIDYYESGVKGDASQKEIENLLQLIYLYFTDPRNDIESFEDWKINEYKALISPSYGLIQEDFNVAVREILQDSTFTPRGSKRYEGANKTDMDRAYGIYNELYGNSSDFTFLISGDFSLDQVIPLVAKYLGNLPNLSTRMPGQKLNSYPVSIEKGPLFNIIDAPETTYEMNSVKYYLKYISRPWGPTDLRDRIRVEALGFLIRSEIDRLRSDYGAALYGARAGSGFNPYLSQYELYFLLDCIPEELEWLRKEVKGMVHRIKEGEIDENVVKETFGRLLYPRYRPSRSNQNNIMIQRLYNYYRYRKPWSIPDDQEDFVKSLTISDLRETAIKYFKDDYLYEFIMR